MFQLEDVRPNLSTPPTGNPVNFTNSFDAYYYLGKVFWCGCEFITFTSYNILTDFDSTFTTRDGMHNLIYYLGEDDMVEEK
ncbi:Auxin-induced protein 5NG4 [Hordeum vulgare]|nr:Auxin-induced protein 5NG4 [Hordeum vulgare]